MTPLYRQPYRPVASRTPRSIAALRSTVPVASKNSEIGITPVTMGIQLHRTSMDKHTKNNGYRLVEICKNNNLTILNGRFGQDKGIGCMTFRNTSVIDYAISSVKGLTLLTDFEVIETDILHSDGHSLITLNVDIPFCSNQTNLKANKSRRRATCKQAKVEPLLKI